MSYDITALEHYLQTPVMNSQPSKTELILLVLLLFCSLSHRNPERLKETLRTTKANISSPSLEMGTAECVPRHTACPACSPNHKGQGFTTALSWQLHLDLQQPCCHIRGLGAATSWKDMMTSMWPVVGHRCHTVKAVRSCVKTNKKNDHDMVRSKTEQARAALTLTTLIAFCIIPDCTADWVLPAESHTI